MQREPKHMRNPFTLISSRRGGPPGITSIERAGEGFLVLNLAYALLERALGRSPRSLARRIAREEVSGVALDLTGLEVPSAERTQAIGRFVDELQVRGLSVVLYQVPATFLVAARMEGSHPRFATATDLAQSLRVLQDYDEMRRRCTSNRGRRINQLRMPARPLSLAPLCVFIGDRLESGGVDPETRLALAKVAYRAVLEILERAYEPGEGDVSAAVAVHEGRATVTILDSGCERTGEAPEAEGAVDRVHRFRILDRHNAIVLEKDLS